MRNGFRNAILAPDVTPIWLQRFVGQRVLYTAGVLLDAIGTVLESGLYARFPGHPLGTPEALPYLGRDRNVIRGPSEPDDLYAGRARTSIDDLRYWGNVYTLLEELRHWWSPNFRSVRIVYNTSIWFEIDPTGVVTQSDGAGNWNWDEYSWDGVSSRSSDAPPPRWWRFWVIFDGSPFFQWTWGDGHRYGDPDLVWGTTAPAWWVNGLRGIIKKFKPEGTYCERVIMTYDDTLFLPTNAAGSPGMPDGTWNVGPNRAAQAPAATYLQGVV